mmetsp:Transcript_41907/g.127083  ORF Transcript_41907/g.127083 Transcript_41907/m.127083 type:complete len:97 (-) Transcript_41907:121-411(-)
MRRSVLILAMPTASLAWTNNPIFSYLTPTSLGRTVARAAKENSDAEIETHRSRLEDAFIGTTADAFIFDASASSTVEPDWFDVDALPCGDDCEVCY